MLTQAQIEACKINKEIVFEAYAQANARLADILDSKKVIEAKAQWLFGGCVSLALGLIGTSEAIASKNGDAKLSLSLAVSAGVFLIAAVFCAVAQLVSNYAGMGSVPRQWLVAGTIDAEEDRLPKILAHMTWYRQGEIDKSESNNAFKAVWLTAAIITGATAPLVLGVSWLVLHRV